MDITRQKDQLNEDHELNDCKFNHLSIGGPRSLPTQQFIRPSASCSTLTQLDVKSSATLKNPALSSSVDYLDRNDFLPSKMISNQLNETIGLQVGGHFNGLNVAGENLHNGILPANELATSLKTTIVRPKRQSLPVDQNGAFDEKTDTFHSSTNNPQNQFILPQQIECLPSTSSTSTIQTSIKLTKEEHKADKSEKGHSTSCAVCGDTGSVAKHYGVMASAKASDIESFFRRALKKADQYECINNDKCRIDQNGRNCCRSCRFRKCLEVGMEPGAVRPDRDFTGRHQLLRLTSTAKRQKTSTPSPQGKQKETKKVDKDEIWMKLPVEVRTILMNLQNIEFKICRGDTQNDASSVYPLHIQTIREAIEDPLKLKGKRTEMRYEPYRMAKTEELHVIVYRRLIAAIDWVECVSEMMGGLCIEDKIVLVKNCFGPLMLFKNASRTAIVTEDENILCVFVTFLLCRGTWLVVIPIHRRMLDELVSPLRKLQVTEHELVCMSAIIVLNPMARDLSEEASDKVGELRNRIQDALYHYVKEVFDDQSPTTRFGTLLLYLPILTALANNLRENIRFAQTFSIQGGIPMLTSLFGCFPVEPFLESDKEGTKIIKKSVETQTDDPRTQLKKKVAKRRLPQSFTSPAENERPSAREFRLLQPPCSYTLIEMFDDRINDTNRQQQNEFQRNQQKIQQGMPSNQAPSLHASAPQLYPLQHSPHLHSSPDFLPNAQLNPQPSQFQFNNNQLLSPQYNQGVGETSHLIPPQIQQQLPRNLYHTISGYPSTSTMNAPIHRMESKHGRDEQWKQIASSIF
ncbi:Nuclear hormone receptor family member nhr-5 [Aphelenchoides bicaudatus]|nr:Nuclear hormone receptor family member nhr-5 [Aphelenchoides bicaudatus]